jgi:choline dehydrogenase-like flavoprotein
VSYQELAPFYDEVERVMGVCGAQDHLPQLPDGVYRDAKPLTPAESLFAERVASRWPERRVVAARGVDEATQNGWSLKTSTGSTLDAAQRTGRLTIEANSIARRLTVDPESGRVSGIEVVDSRTKISRVVPARVVVVCASTLESVKLLLNSASARHPAGLGNSSGLLGHYIMNKVSRSVTFLMTVDGDSRVHPLSAADSFVIPRYENIVSQTDLRGGFGMWGAIQRMSVPSGLRASAPPGSVLGLLIGYGECLPYVDNQVELNRDAVDEWGNPTLRVDVRWRENEEMMGQRIREDLLAMVAAAGGRVMETAAPAFARPLFERIQKAGSIPGRYVHEVGGARMGTAPGDSVVNPHCQLWDSKNVFVTDGACWPTAGWQNPTLTMMAITARSCNFLADRVAGGDL